MKAFMMLVLVGALGAGGFFAWRYVQGVQTRNAFLEEARKIGFQVPDRDSLSASEAEEKIRELLETWSAELKVRPAGEDAVEIRSIPLNISADCELDPTPPEYDLLITNDQGNVNNRVVRCLPTTLVGFSGTFVSDGRTFDARGYTWVKGD